MYQQTFMAMLVTLAFTWGSALAAPPGGDWSVVQLERVKLYFGWEFEYSSSLERDAKEDEGAEDGKVRVKLENYLTFAEIPGSRNIKRLWKAYRENPGEPHLDDKKLLHVMAGFDGNSGRFFTRKYLSQGIHGAIENMGQIYAFEAPNYEDNIFETFISAGPHGINQHQDPTGGVLQNHPAKFAETGSVERLGESATRVTADLSVGTRFEALVSGPPEYLLLEQKITDKNGKLLRHLEVTRLDRFQGTLYPAAGHLSDAAVEKLPGKDYKFEVNRVHLQDESEWFPEWPVGTRVIDHVNGSMQTVIPYPPEVLERIKPGALRESPGARKRWLIPLNITIAVVLIGLIWWRVRSRRGA